MRRWSEDQGCRERYSLCNSYVDACSSENSKEQDIVGSLAVCLQPCQVLWSRRFHHFRHLFRKEIAKILDCLVDNILGNINIPLTWSWSWGRRHGFVEGRKTLPIPATKVQDIYSLLKVFLSAICFWLVSIFYVCYACVPLFCHDRNSFVEPFFMVLLFGSFSMKHTNFGSCLPTSIFIPLS